MGREMTCFAGGPQGGQTINPKTRPLSQDICAEQKKSSPHQKKSGNPHSAPGQVPRRRRQSWHGTCLSYFLSALSFLSPRSPGQRFGHRFGVYISPLQRGISQRIKLYLEVLGGSKEAQESSFPLLQSSHCQSHQSKQHCSPRKRATGGETAPRSSHLVDLGRLPHSQEPSKRRQALTITTLHHPCLRLFKPSSSATQSQHCQPFNYSLTADPASPPYPSQLLFLDRLLGGDSPVEK